MVAARGVAMVMDETVVVVEIHLAKMELEVGRTKATSNVSSATSMDTMQIDVQMLRSRRRHIMLVQRRQRSHKHSCLQRLK